jgi:NAD+-dependent protein deacetylase SIR2
LLRFHPPSAKAREARSARPLKIGTLRPAIVLYDEAHPLGDEIGAIQTADLSRKPDLLIVMGTSLKVHGLRKLVKEFAKSVHETSSSSTHSKGKVIFVNKTAPPNEWAGIIDYHVEGETDQWVDKVLEDWKKMRPADWEVQKTLIAGDGGVAISGFKTTKNVQLKGKGKIFIQFRQRKLLNLGPSVHKKKPAPDSENIPPVASPKTLKNSKCPDSVLKSRPSTPLSPNKRRQGSCHYSDVESSPSKRHSSLSLPGSIPEAERGLLFVKECAKSKPEGDSIKRKITRAKEGHVASRKQLTRTKSEVWVEITST